jgi:hypothetical protein
VQERGWEQPAPVEQDSRGILDPAEVIRATRLNRYPAGPELAGLVQHVWTVSWDLPPGAVFTPRMVQHPCANLYVSHGEADDDGVPGPLEANLEGVFTDRTSRRIGGTGWCVAAMTTCGGLGAFLTGPAARFNDREVPLGAALDLDGHELVATMSGLTEEVDRVEHLLKVLTGVLARADPARVAAARQVAAVARRAETDRTLRQVGDLARAAGVGVRTLQRMFTEHAGVSPTWVLRRYRLLEAAERVREGRPGLVGAGRGRPRVQRPGAPRAGLPLGGGDDARRLRERPAAAAPPGLESRPWPPIRRCSPTTTRS